MEATVTATIERAASNDIHDADREDELVTSAELSECTCPDWCARDHDRD